MTSIEWTDKTWNPVVGCSRVSAGCDHCYAMGVAHRKMSPQHHGLTKLRPKGSTRPGIDWNGTVRTVPDRLAEPMSWGAGLRVFVNSMSDLFHDGVPFEFVAAVFGVMAATPRHTYQILTKRPRRMLDFFDWYEGMSGTGADATAAIYAAIDAIDDRINARIGRAMEQAKQRTAEGDTSWPLDNVHLGVSVEDQATADERIPLALEVPARVVWVSYEPALGPVDFSPWVGSSWKRGDIIGGGVEALEDSPRRLDWIVVGGEAGPGARRFDVAWARGVLDVTRGTTTAAFVKQLGAKPEEYLVTQVGQDEYGNVDDDGDWHPLKLADRKGKDPSEWPPGLFVREMPGAGA